MHWLTEPRLGVLDLIQTAGSLAQTDLNALKGEFVSASLNREQAPKCEVLFIYGSLQPDGSFLGTDLDFWGAVRQSGASIVIIGTEHDPETYTTMAGLQSLLGLNLVMTIKRNGEAFDQFFGALFNAMNNGASMPTAWNRLARQTPGAIHHNVPEAIFAAGLGQVAFRKDSGTTRGPLGFLGGLFSRNRSL